MKTNTAARKAVFSDFGFRPSFGIRHSSFVIPYCVLLAAFFVVPSSSASTNLSTTLQQALFEEEANHNLTAAIQSYQSLITQFDQDRKLAATAIFRLGECYRKQGNTNDASAQYQRVVREFSDQSTLLNLSRQSLAALGIAPTSPASSGITTAAHSEQKRLFEEEIKLAEKQLASQQQLVKVGRISPDEIIPAQRDLLKLRRQLAALDAGQSLLDINLDTASASTSAEAEEVKRIQALIKDSPDLINSVAPGGLTLLQSAASKGELSIVKLLLDNGAAVDGVSYLDLTPLHYAAANGRKAVVDFLLSKGAKASAQNGAGITPLHLAAGKGYELVAKTLLQAHASVNAPTTAQSVLNPFGVGFEAGQTPLHIAALGGYSAIVQLLLEKGAEPNAVDEPGRTPLSYAAEKGDENIAKILLAAHADPNAGKRELPLVVATRDTSLMELLLSKGAAPNTNTIWGGTGNRTLVSPLFVAVFLKRPEAIKTLVRFKADPNILNSQRNPVIFDALSRRDLDTLKALLDSGANPNILAQDGYTPLATAVNGHDNPSVETLLAHHADPNQKIEATFGEGGKGYTPLLIATAKVLPDLVDVLLAAGADPDLRSETRAPLLNAINNENPPARKQMAASLLDHGAKPDARDANGKTPLMYAIFRNDKETAAMLLAHKADVNAADTDGGTALHYAVSYNHPDLVELLLGNKADPNARNNSGRTPLDLAKSVPGQPGQPAAYPSGPPLSYQWTTPGVPGIPQPSSPSSFATRLAQIQQKSTPVNPEADSAPPTIADILRQHGAADELPDFSLVRVSRKGMGPWIVFKRDTNSFNRFTLFETLATASSLNIQYPDFSQLKIHRAEPSKPGKSKEIRVNPMLTPNTFDCAKDTWLEFGDVVEIPEREHTLTEPAGFYGNVFRGDTLTKCLARKVKFVVREESVELSLAGYGSESYLASAIQRPTVQNILRSTSDFSRVHVKRTDPETKKPTEYKIDVQSIWFNKSPHTDDLWLRDGDVIEVPDKAE